mmetsp:Transcript_56947/g.157673  ORF Transcript_56947/g.157673 Transcript_56947/m.157673 type:complete len:200 (-) Transcript_56947:101-700(-)
MRRSRSGSLCGARRPPKWRRGRSRRCGRFRCQGCMGAAGRICTLPALVAAAEAAGSGAVAQPFLAAARAAGSEVGVLPRRPRLRQSWRRPRRPGRLRRRRLKSSGCFARCRGGGPRLGPTDSAVPQPGRPGRRPGDDAPLLGFGLRRPQRRFPARVGWRRGPRPAAGVRGRQHRQSLRFTRSPIQQGLVGRLALRSRSR